MSDIGKTAISAAYRALSSEDVEWTRNRTERVFKLLKKRGFEPVAREAEGHLKESLPYIEVMISSRPITIEAVVKPPEQKEWARAIPAARKYLRACTVYEAQAKRGVRMEQLWHVVLELEDPSKFIDALPRAVEHVDAKLRLGWDPRGDEEPF